MSTPIYGVDQLGLVRTQATYDTIAAFSTSHGFGYNSLKITPELAFGEYAEHVGTASLQGEFQRKYGGKWDVECYHKVNGAATAPQHGPFLLAAGMSFSGGIYSLNASQPTALQIGRKSGTSLYELISGGWVEKIEIEQVGASAAIFRASGGFATYGALLGVPVTSSSTYSSSATSIALATASKWKVLPGVYVAFGSEDNSGSGYLVTAVASDGVTLTISPGLANGIGATQTVTPVVPAATISGTVIGGVSDGLTLDSTSLGFISGKVTLETGIHGLDKESTADRPNRLARGKRRVMFEGEFYFLDENTPFLGGTHVSTLRSIAMRSGANTAGSRLIANIPSARFDMAPIDIPDADEATYKIKALGRQNSAANDEFTIDTN